MKMYIESNLLDVKVGQYRETSLPCSSSGPLHLVTEPHENHERRETVPDTRHNNLNILCGLKLPTFDLKGKFIRSCGREV